MQDKRRKGAMFEPRKLLPGVSITAARLGMRSDLESWVDGGKTELRPRAYHIFDLAVML
jgi:hypothetical protein